MRSTIVLWQTIAFLLWKLREVRKELKGVLLGKSYVKIENICNMEFDDWLKMMEKECKESE